MAGRHGPPPTDGPIYETAMAAIVDCIVQEAYMDVPPSVKPTDLWDVIRKKATKLAKDKVFEDIKNRILAQPERNRS